MASLSTGEAATFTKSGFESKAGMAADHPLTKMLSGADFQNTFELEMTRFHSSDIRYRATGILPAEFQITDLSNPANQPKSNDQIILASSPDKAEAQTLRRPTPKEETDPKYCPTVSISSLMQIADKEFRQKHKYADSPSGPGKCNVFIDDIMREAGLPRPWAQVGVLSTEKLNQMLAKDPRYDCAWKTDYSSDANYQNSYKNWANFKLHAGDIVVWATKEGVVHMAIADGHGKLYAAGSRHNASGTSHVKTEVYMGDAVNQTNFGPPTAVYRYKGATN
jgi:hypothetical protein